MEKQVLPLDAALRGDFFRLHSTECGEGWCCCAAWWTATWDGWTDRTADENRALREELFDRNQFDGYLLYVDGRPVGWCQVGPRDRFTKLTAQLRLEPDESAWAVTCFLILPAFRRQGLARFLLSEVLTDLRRRGVQRVEAYPKPAARDDGDLWNGPESLFRSLGFRTLRDDAPRKIMSLDLTPVP
ncbi:MAG: GNAT family N-acetyltransferase [Planctomycetia bacterium]|nr:GNAT family N-acetyltransferase [Planctomycetia bacterium]